MVLTKTPPNEDNFRFDTSGLICRTCARKQRSASPPWHPAPSTSPAPGSRGSHSTSSSGSDGRPTPVSPVLTDLAPYGFPEWAEDLQAGRWHFSEKIELTNDLG